MSRIIESHAHVDFPVGGAPIKIEKGMRTVRVDLADLSGRGIAVVDKEGGIHPKSAIGSIVRQPHVNEVDRYADTQRFFEEMNA